MPNSRSFLLSLTLASPCTELRAEIQACVMSSVDLLKNSPVWTESKVGRVVRRNKSGLIAPGGSKISFTVVRDSRQKLKVTWRSIRRFEVESLYGRPTKPFDSPNNGEPRLPMGCVTFTLLKTFLPTTLKVNA